MSNGCEGGGGVALKSDSELLLFQDTSVLTHVENKKTGTVSDVVLMYQVSYQLNIIPMLSPPSPPAAAAAC